MRATTDSQPHVDFDKLGEGVNNLLHIATACVDREWAWAQTEFSGMRYGDFKKRGGRDRPSRPSNRFKPSIAKSRLSRGTSIAF